MCVRVLIRQQWEVDPRHPANLSRPRPRTVHNNRRLNSLAACSGEARHSAACLLDACYGNAFVGGCAVLLGGGGVCGDQRSGVDVTILIDSAIHTIVDIMSEQ